MLVATTLFNERASVAFQMLNLYRLTKIHYTCSLIYPNEKLMELHARTHTHTHIFNCRMWINRQSIWRKGKRNQSQWKAFSLIYVSSYGWINSWKRYKMPCHHSQSTTLTKKKTKKKFRRFSLIWTYFECWKVCVRLTFEI